MLHSETHIIQRGEKYNTGKLLLSLYQLCVSIPNLFVSSVPVVYRIFESHLIYKMKEFREPLCREASPFIANLRLQV